MPQLEPTGTTTLTDPDGRRNVSSGTATTPHRPTASWCSSRKAGRSTSTTSPTRRTKKFSSKDGVTLGMMRLGDYLLSDHDLPFSGPFGLTRFVIDFLLSPADIEVTDGIGRRTGNFGGQILAEIPDSHPCYLLPGCYMLPERHGADAAHYRECRRPILVPLRATCWAVRLRSRTSPLRRDRRMCWPSVPMPTRFASRRPRRSRSG